MRNRMSIAALVGILSVAAAAPLPAGSVSPSTVIAFQALTTDMEAATVELTTGFDPSAVFTYGGTFDQTGWNGTFGGTYEGLPVSGTMDGSITGDPNYMISGETEVFNKDGMKEPGSSISITWTQVDTPAGKPLMFKVKSASIGMTKFTTTKPFTQTTKGDMMILRGMLTQNYMGTLYNYKVAIDVNTKDNTFKSSFRLTEGPMAGKEHVVDKGSYSVAMAGPNFNGAMNELVTIASVPEPSSLVLAGTAAVAGLGLWHWRRRRRSKP